VLQHLRITWMKGRKRNDPVGADLHGPAHYCFKLGGSGGNGADDAFIYRPYS
jgi:hypothetical protein